MRALPEIVTVGEREVNADALTDDKLDVLIEDRSDCVGGKEGDSDAAPVATGDGD